MNRTEKAGNEWEGMEEKDGQKEIKTMWKRKEIDKVRKDREWKGKF